MGKLNITEVDSLQEMSTRKIVGMSFLFCTFLNKEILLSLSDINIFEY